MPEAPKPEIYTDAYGTRFAIAPPGSGAERILATGIDVRVIDADFVLDWVTNRNLQKYLIHVSSGFKDMALGDVHDWGFTFQSAHSEKQIQRNLVRLSDGLSTNLPTGFFSIQWQHIDPVEEPGSWLGVYVE